MRVISLKILKDFFELHSDAEQPLRAWLREAKSANWTDPAQIKEQYKSASILKGKRVVFNIKGNYYRLVAAVAYKFGAVYIKFIGTHEAYNKIDANTVDME